MENTATIINIKEKYNLLKSSNDYTMYIFDYSNSSFYFDDLIHELTDDMIDIYYYDLNKWIANTNDASAYMEQVVQEFGIDAKNYNFYEHVQQAQYFYYSDSLYNDIDIIKESYLLAQLICEDVLEIDDNNYNDLLDIAINSEKSDEINDAVQEYITPCND